MQNQKERNALKWIEGGPLFLRACVSPDHSSHYSSIYAQGERARQSLPQIAAIIAVTRWPLFDETLRDRVCPQRLILAFVKPAHYGYVEDIVAG